MRHCSKLCCFEITKPHGPQSDYRLRGIAVSCLFLDYEALQSTVCFQAPYRHCSQLCWFHTLRHCSQLCCFHTLRHCCQLSVFKHLRHDSLLSVFRLRGFAVTAAVCGDGAHGDNPVQQDALRQTSLSGREGQESSALWTGDGVAGNAKQRFTSKSER